MLLMLLWWRAGVSSEDIDSAGNERLNLTR
jgi:hypothetical protein